MLSETLKDYSTLKSLNLSCKEEGERVKKEKKQNHGDCSTGNHIGAEGAKAMCEVLRVNTTLTSLDIGGEEELIKELKGEKHPIMSCLQGITLGLKERGHLVKY